MPTGMESTIKVRVGDFLLTGVVFGSTLFVLGTKVRLEISGQNIMLFDRKKRRLYCPWQPGIFFKYEDRTETIQIKSIPPNKRHSLSIPFETG